MAKLCYVNNRPYDVEMVFKPHTYIEHMYCHCILCTVL